MKEGGGGRGDGGDEASASVGWTETSAGLAGLVGAGLRLTAAAFPAPSQQPADSAPYICDCTLLYCYQQQQACV